MPTVLPAAYRDPVGRPRVVVADVDLLARAQRARRRVERATAEMTAARSERDGLVAEMRAAGYGYDVIASTLGMTKARVQQVTKSLP